MSTRLHRSEVRHQLGRVQRRHGMTVVLDAVEKHLGFPISEAGVEDLRGIIAALSAVVDAPTVADAQQELAAFRDGYLQLCWDHHTEHSPHQTSYNHADEPVTQVQYTYEGRPAWHCAACLRVTLESDDDVDVCRGCGADDLRALFYETPCTDEGHQG